jgi:hypothetical protein
MCLKNPRAEPDGGSTAEECKAAATVWQIFVSDARSDRCGGRMLEIWRFSGLQAVAGGWRAGCGRLADRLRVRTKVCRIENFRFFG